MRWRTWIGLGVVGLGVVAAGMGLAWWRWGWRGVASVRPADSVVLTEPILSWSGHDERWAQIEEPVYRLHLVPGGGATGELLFFGSHHTRDPGAEQVRRLRADWKVFRPTVALVESRLGTYFGGFDGGVRQFGEPGAVYWLGRESGVPVYSIEPEYEDEIAALTARFDPKDVLLRAAMSVYGSELRAGMVKDPDSHFMHLLRKRARAPQLKGLFATSADVDAYWAERYPGLADWRTAPEWPESSPPHQMFYLSNLVRDEHAARVIVDLVRQGERVFAISGMSHTVKQEPAIRALLPGHSDGAMASGRPWEDSSQ